MTTATKPSSIFLGYVIDVVAPTAAFYLLSKLGIPPLWGLLLGSVIALGSLTINSLRLRRLDPIGILVLIEIALSIALLFALRDPRFLLAKPSFYTAIAGIYLIATSFQGKPLTYEGARQVGAKGDPARIALFERAWERSPQFRKVLRVAAMGWGLAFLIDSILRVIIVYRFPLERATWLAQVPHVTALVVLMGFSALMGRTTKRIVEEQADLVDSPSSSSQSASTAAAQESSR